jgi:hypothetical protein
VSVSSDGIAFRRRKVDPQELRVQLDLFDGRAAYHTLAERGRQVEVNQMDDLQLRALEFSTRTFGLIPILQQLLDPATKAVYLGRSRGQDKFKVKSPTGGWILYSDQGHIIRSVEIGHKSIEYADYRSVGGVRLPFIQRFSTGGHLNYELVFTRIDLTPDFPDNHFSRAALSWENVR